MANIASVLKAEIARVARKEVRAEIEQLKKASSAHRSAIAQLRRHVADLEKQLKEARRQAGSTARGRPASQAAQADEVPRRFSATRLAAHRERIGLSAAAYGKLVGMSGQTIYLWERGSSRPNPEQLQRLAAVRALSRRSALQQLGDG